MGMNEVEWIDFNQYIELQLPSEFSFYECLVYLNRSDIECLHKVKDDGLYKLLKYEDSYVLFKINVHCKRMRITFLNVVPTSWVKDQVAGYVWDMFDLSTDLSLFIESMKNDKILSLLISKYRGLRVIKMNDLFEGICWAIMGQQINLKFAYTLKRKLVEKYGEKFSYSGEDFFIFPTPEKIAQLEIEDLKALQFTQKKAEYVIGIAKLFANGSLDKNKLVCEKGYEDLVKKLVAIRGIGNWTADYTIMKCFHLNCAFPIADVGLHNALKDILKLDEKPSLHEIQKFAQAWKGWEAYATFYIWRWLYD
ncbi:DNA-3-methyladenine glycosylase II [Anaerosolibacter carboniphilus]|uniref:DNA-3-methyladenine glycosylase II n=1 Tax=Anaerosolibacter carboniphilus TaxID=1417629 RepID=A0A841KWZ0_9FIRM|nr:DNA-3-methyladenine glycosylase [Anaerosolibacter carboniphilus]MBB6217883.1 DNA-3-methyladenine glycosylase II [Anaerosolibacter carboniphilus]